MKSKLKIVREYEASIEDVWEMWTTKEGIEAWWGPDGFFVEVRSIDLRPEGELRYAMIARDPEMVAFMKREGMPVTQECRLTFTEIAAPRRLAYLHPTDFIPGIAPYDVLTEVDLEPLGDKVRLTLTFDRMHDDTWTNRASMGWEMELGKLATALKSRAAV